MRGFNLLVEILHYIKILFNVESNNNQTERKEKKTIIWKATA